MSNDEKRSLYDFRRHERRPQRRALVDAARPVGADAFAQLEARVAELERKLAEHTHGYRADATIARAADRETTPPKPS